MASPEALGLSFFNLDNPNEEVLEIWKALVKHERLPCSKCHHPSPCSFYWMGAAVPDKTASRSECHTINIPSSAAEERPVCNSTDVAPVNCYSDSKSDAEVLNNGLDIDPSQNDFKSQQQIPRQTTQPPGIHFPHPSQPTVITSSSWIQPHMMAAPAIAGNQDYPVQTTTNGMLPNWQQSMGRTFGGAENQPTYQVQYPLVNPLLYPWAHSIPAIPGVAPTMPGVAPAMAGVPSPSPQDASAVHPNYLSTPGIPLLSTQGMVPPPLNQSPYMNAAYPAPSPLESRTACVSTGMETSKTRTTPVVSLRDTQPVDSAAELYEPPMCAPGEVVSERSIEEDRSLENVSTPWSDIPVDEDPVESISECHEEKVETISEIPDATVVVVKNPEIPPSISVRDDVKPRKQEPPETVVTSTSTPSIWSGKRSFASVLSENQKPITKTGPVETLPEASVNQNSNVDAVKDVDPRLVDLNVFLETYKVDYDPVCYQPRGLMNKSNWCYVNSALQALLACSPLYTLLQKLPKTTPKEGGTKTPTPIIDTMINFYSKFDKIKRSPLKSKDGQPCEINPGQPFEPSVVYDMLAVLKSNTYKVEGRQEDAEEFLSHVLNGLHDEMIEVQKVSPKKTNLVVSNGSVDSNDADDGWQVQTHRRKTCVARDLVNPTETPISEIFRGKIRAVLNTPSGTPTATLTPFYSLQLDIKGEGVVTLQSALQNLTSKEMIEDFTCSKTRQEVTASRQMLLEELPPILILHLKRFVYDATTGDSNKLMTRVEPSMVLNINKELLSADSKRKLGSKPIKYKLFGVIYHSGQEMTKGHYITDIFHFGYRQWIRFNDAEVKAISENTVLKHNPPSVPYILVYKREDGAQRTHK